MSEIKINDVWLITFSVPYKNKNELTRPFLVLENTNNKAGGIPITSFTTERYKKNLGDLIITAPFLSRKSIIKPYQLIYLKKEFFIKKIGNVEPKIVNNINQTIDANARNYLSVKNTSSILREFVIEKQTQQITNLKSKNEEKDKKINILNLEHIVQTEKIIDLERKNEEKDQKISKLESDNNELLEKVAYELE